MTFPSALYRPSLALLTDLYQLTMGYAAWKEGLADTEAVFTLFFRRHPYGGGFTIAAGLEFAADYVEHFRFDEEDLAFVAAQTGADGAPLFEPGFIEYLRQLRLTVDVDAVPEGTAVFPYEPVIRVRGPIVACMLLETPLLDLVNFQTLIATKAARVCLAARGEPVVEFGLRRAQGVDGGLSASRAAYLGGCAGTSNVLAGRLFGIPVKGTHAHSWVMLFDDERAAFETYARALPGNCLFLVDTYDSLEGVRHAIEVGRWLRERGKKLLGIRLDSGDLAWLSIEARRLLDEAGFPEATVFASNELDEIIIDSLKEQGARIAAWGVGTRLVTGASDGALGGVYKLTAVRRPGEEWKYRVKLSERLEKTTIPGLLQVRRFVEGGKIVADAIYDEWSGLPDPVTIVDPLDLTRRKTLDAGARGEDLLQPVFRAGRPTGSRPTLEEARARVQAQLALLHPGVKRFVNPHQLPAGLEKGLHERRTALVLAARAES